MLSGKDLVFYSLEILNSNSKYNISITCVEENLEEDIIILVANAHNKPVSHYRNLILQVDLNL